MRAKQNIGHNFLSLHTWIHFVNVHSFHGPEGASTILHVSGRMRVALGALKCGKAFCLLSSWPPVFVFVYVTAFYNRIN